MASRGLPVLLGLTGPELAEAKKREGVAEIELRGSSICVISDVTAHSWLRPEYYGPDKKRLDFLHLLDIDLAPDDYTQIVRVLAERARPFVIETDFSDLDQRVDKISRAANELGMTALVQGTKASHHFYKERFTILNRTSPEASGSIYTDNYPQHSPHTYREISMSQADIEYAWEAYQAAFMQIVDEDPVQATLTEADFTHILRDPEYLKYVHRVDGLVANLMIICDVALCDWLNDDFLAGHPKSDREPHFACPLVFSVPGQKPYLTRHSFVEMVRSFDAFRLNPTMLIECNQMSNQKIPTLARFATSRSQLMSLEFNEVDYRQSFVKVTLA
ncbi:MAG: hypothetical protein AAF413_03150 [Patescibacteria group bacterium]